MRWDSATAKQNIWHLAKPARNAGEFFIGRISGYRGKTSKRTNMEFLVSWKGYSAKDYTWELYKAVCKTQAFVDYCYSNKLTSIVNKALLRGQSCQNSSILFTGILCKILSFLGVLRQHLFQESLVGRNPTYPVDHTSPGTSPADGLQQRYSVAQSFRGKQVGGKTAATRLEDALVLAVHVMLYILVSQYRFILNLGERGGSVSSGLYDQL